MDEGWRSMEELMVCRLEVDGAVYGCGRWLLPLYERESRFFWIFFVTVRGSTRMYIYTTEKMKKYSPTSVLL